MEKIKSFLGKHIIVSAFVFIFIGAGVIEIIQASAPEVKTNFSSFFSSLWSVRVDIVVVLAIIGLMLYIIRSFLD